MVIRCLVPKRRYYRCPEYCNRRDNIVIDDNVPLYSMGLEFDLGQVDVTRNGTAHEDGINFQSIPLSFVQEFEALTNNLTQNIKSSTLRDQIKIKPQDIMHISLSYLCCLTKQEFYFAKEYLYQWIIENYPFDIPITYERLECLQERFNSVTNILILDEASQKKLIQLNHNLRDYLTIRNIPVPILRENQMPFHSTVLGFYLGTDNDNRQPENDISLNLSTIAQVIASTKHGPYTKGMRIKHAPHIVSGSFVFIDRQQHAGPVEKKIPP
jgi:hypothetical protein